MISDGSWLAFAVGIRCRHIRLSQPLPVWSHVIRPHSTRGWTVTVDGGGQLELRSGPSKQVTQITLIIHAVLLRDTATQWVGWRRRNALNSEHARTENAGLQVQTTGGKRCQCKIREQNHKHKILRKSWRFHDVIVDMPFLQKEKQAQCWVLTVKMFGQNNRYGALFQYIPDVLIKIFFEGWVKANTQQSKIARQISISNRTNWAAIFTRVVATVVGRATVSGHSRDIFGYVFSSNSF